MNPQPTPPNANQIFNNLYTAVTLATSTNGYGDQFTWRNDSEPFPYQEASWADVAIQPCSENGGRLTLKATTYPLKPNDKNFSTKVQRVQEVWETQGYTVKHVFGTGSMETIATEFDDGTVVTYLAGVGGEAVTASTECHPEFDKNNENTAQTYPAHNAATLKPTAALDR
ncbi:hypothetical protein [Rothia nasimurium]|uniref:hypothetical protein n=1 Tax=Rothia nasimurium TaxID=85336 RepID=UPI001179C5AA|nr:hypothetical protein [Rothia nasimurium]